MKKHLVTVSLVLENPNEEEQAYLEESLHQINLNRTLNAGQGRSFTLPPHTFVGTIDGEDTVQIADDVLARAREAIWHLGLHGNVFVSVGQQWVWRGQHLDKH